MIIAIKSTYLLLPASNIAAKLDPGENDVERHPGEHKQHHDCHQHLDHLELGPLLHALHLAVLGVSRDVAVRHAYPDENVADGDQDGGHNVAEQQVGQQEVQVAVHAWWPHFQANLQVGHFLEDGHQVEEQSPRDGGGEGD